jgi:hypothetical protein
MCGLGTVRRRRVVTYLGIEHPSISPSSSLLGGWLCGGHVMYDYRTPRRSPWGRQHVKGWWWTLVVVVVVGVSSSCIEFREPADRD